MMSHDTFEPDGNETIHSKPEEQPATNPNRDRLLTYLEFIIVGGVIFGSLVSWTFPVMPMMPDVLLAVDNQFMSDTIRLELFALLILLAAFGARGRSIREIHWRMSPKILGVTYLLFASDYLLTHIMWSIGALWFPAWDTNDPHFFKSATLSLPLLFAFSCLNGFFEEVAVVGYLSACLGKYHGAVICGLLSVLIRLSYHAYQGPVNLISLIPMGVGFYYVYWRYKSIWPLVFAHAVMDYAYILLSATAP